MLADAINTYTWSTDGDLTSRTPKNGGVGYNFSSTFVGVTNQMRLDSIAGSDGSSISFYYDPFQRLVSRHWPAPRGDDALYYDGPDVVLELRYPSAGGSQWVRYVHGPGADQPLATEVYPPAPRRRRARDRNITITRTAKARSGCSPTPTARSPTATTMTPTANVSA